MGLGRFVSLAAVLALSAGLAQADEIQTIYQRQLEIGLPDTDSQQVRDYLSTIQADGTWSAVDYTTGCDAPRANWPAASHWSRILAMSTAYHGPVNGSSEFVKSAELRTAIGKAMDYWFAHDFSTIGNGACMDGGGKANDMCPCGTPGLWNQNWYSNVITIPRRVGKSCLLFRDELSPTQYGNCTLMTARAYTPFFRERLPGYVSGANILGMAVVGISAGLLENNGTGNATRIMDAYGRAHNEVATVYPGDREDGIKPDASFQQHNGIIYTGNYGKDFANSIMELEITAMGTQYQANKTVQDSFGRFIGGSQWSTFVNTVTEVPHWDMSVIGRMITWPAVDLQATENLKMNLTQVMILGQSWSQPDLIEFAKDLSNTNSKTTNPGDLSGNRMFWNSDYMAHRTQKTVTTVKMISNRTATSECVNDQNPMGFHLSDGAVYTYTTGAEYEDMYATFDFNLVPGTTTDYGNTPLTCSATQAYSPDKYAGGTSAGDVGIAAMRYVNPLTGAFSFHKAYIFFADNVQHVLVNSISSTSDAPVFSVLDQRLRSGDVYINSERAKSGNYSDVDSLWHAGTGYIFPLAQGTEVSIDVEKKTGDWKTIGVSKQPISTKDMFSAWIVHDSANLTTPTQYSVFPATESNKDFKDKADRYTPYTVANTDVVSAAVDSARRTLGAAFWEAGGGTVYVPYMGLTITVDKPVVLMLKLTGNGSSEGELSIADPTHENAGVSVHIVWAAKGHRRADSHIGHHHSPLRRASGQSEVTLAITLPAGGLAGSTVTQEFSRDQ
ncbi:hypothetical protein FRC10_009393 [Ceratobasidium sp. 414]|nr:hypothetical protein FRC10_009393 [Ceratobasidium sp. 414]